MAGTGLGWWGCSVLLPVEDRERADTQELGNLFLGDLSSKTAALDMLAQRLGLFGKRLGFLGF